MVVNRLLAAVVQSQDADNVCSTLQHLGFAVNRLSSHGGFLGTRNLTLLVGFEEGQEENVVRIFEQNCRQRVEYLSTPLEGMPVAMPMATPVTVGGAIIFTLKVERHEVIE